MAESGGDTDVNGGVEKAKENVAEDMIDEKKVETAIKFLQNSNVRKTTFENRVAFLKKKGLNQKEIDIAIERSGTQGDKEVNFKQDQKFNQQQKENLNTPPQATAISSAMVPQPRSFSSQVSSVVIGGGIIYGAIYALKNYVIPYFTGGEQSEMAVLAKSIKDLNKGITELASLMRNTIGNIEAKLEDQQEILSKVSSEVDITKRKLEVIPSDVTSLSDVRAEISSVKGLLLGRHQFPATPFTSTSPSIPAWQKASARKKQADVKQVEDASTDGKSISEENCPDHQMQDRAESLLTNDISVHHGAEKDANSSTLEDSNDREVAELTSNDSKSSSSSYVKVADEQ